MGPMLHTGHYGWIDVPVDPRHVAREQSLKQKLNARTQAYKLLVQKLDSARAETSVTEVPELSEKRGPDLRGKPEMMNGDMIRSRSPLCALAHVLKTHHY
eukprot:gene1154-1725_t